LKHLKNIGSCIFGGEREESGKLVRPNHETMKKEVVWKVVDGGVLLFLVLL
jgi:hypothetical protein